MDDLDRLDLERAQASRVPAFQQDVEAPPEPDQHEDRAREHHGGRKARPRGGEKIPGGAIASIRLDGAADAAGIPRNGKGAGWGRGEDSGGGGSFKKKKKKNM